MRRFRVLMPLVLAVALIGLVVGGRAMGGTAAQDAPPAATAGHPAVGAWLLSDPAFPADPPTLVAFHADGVYLQAEAEGGVGVGTWEATGERSLALTFVEQFGDEAGGVVRLTIRASGEVDASGTTLTATYTLELTLPDGTSQGEFGPGAVTAERIAVEPQGTPVGSLDDLFAQFEEGTPEAGTPVP